MDRGAWQATILEVAKSQTWLKWLSMGQGIIPLHWTSPEATIPMKYNENRNSHPTPQIVQSEVLDIIFKYFRVLSYKCVISLS